MQDFEHFELRRVEDVHWFYRGKREIARLWLDRLESEKILDRRNARMLDIGCGSGAMMVEASPVGEVFGLEVSHVALLNLREKVRGKTLAGSVLHLPWKNETFDLISCFDVIEHIENDFEALKEIRRVLKPGGIMLVNVPAYQWLWSDWDIFLGHYRRYTRSSLTKLLDRCKFSILHSSYENFVGLFPAIAVRILRKCFGSKYLKVENAIPPRFINAALKKFYVWPSRGGSKWIRCGLSVWAVVRK